MPAPDPASGDISALIGRLWSEVLGTVPVPGTSMFSQGGDSLLATQLASRLGEALGLRVPIRTVLENPEPTALATELERLRRQPLSSPQASMSPPTRQAATLSFSEERMWFMHAFAPGNIAYNIGLTLRLIGPLNVSAIRVAVNRVVNRHAVLRSNYVTVASGLARVTQSYCPVELVQTRLPTGNNPQQVDQELREHLSRSANRPFDLAHDPLFRFELVHIGDGDALLFVLMHHIIGDQWSLDTLSRELADIYNSIVLGSGKELLDPAIDYRDYAAWHRQWFRREREQTELAYWLNRLAGLETITFNPDHPRPPQQSFRGSRHLVPFDPGLSAALRKLGAGSGSTLAMVLLAALNVLLHRHTGKLDIAIGVPIANRHHPGSEGLVGTLLNTLVLRTDLAGDPAFQAVIERVRNASLDAYEHQDMPFELLVQALRLPRDPSHAPLFGVMFNMLNTPLGNLEFKNLAWSRFEFDRRAAQFDLTLTIDADHDRSIVFEYATDLYEEATIRRIADQFVALLYEVVAAPEAHISHLPINCLSDTARLETWAKGPDRKILHKTLTALLNSSFSANAKRIALTYGSENLDYRELERQIDILARSLRGRGIARGCRVGLFLRRSHWLLIAPLAVLKAGAAWVPLDPAYPRERLIYMAQDAELDLIITETDLSGQVPWPSDRTLNVDAPHTPVVAESAVTWDGDLDATPEDAAYVIYTSGSTGHPKGVIVPHRAVCNFLASMRREPGIHSDDRLLAVTTLGFDIAVLELLLPLTVGARVVLAEQSDVISAQRLGRLIEDHAVTLMQATPSTWRMLIGAGWKKSPSFRKALVGGESLAPDLAVALRDRFPEVWNMYGPTETTIWSSCWRVDENVNKGRISIGSPIDNTQIRVLDSYGKRCPLGVPGELFIGGLGLATGYLKRPALDEDRFVTDPFSTQPGARMYRTGDRARWLDDGQLQHMGRLDFQVKVRGHRIELGEIEARLDQHPALCGSVVVAREDRPGDVRLVAYIVPSDVMPESADLRAFLKMVLPEFMVPQHFVELDAIPVLPNGKFNRVGLPAASAHLAGSTRLVPPRSITEKRLRQLWMDVLGIEHFGVEDNFFDLGGHSMLAVQLLGRICDEFGIDISLPWLFAHPTICAFAAVLQKPIEKSKGTLVALQPEGAQAPLFCLCGIHLYQALAAQFAPSRPVYGIYIPEEMSLAKAAQNAPIATTYVRELAASYLAVIRRRQPKGPYHLVGFSFGGILAFEIAQQLRSGGDEVGLLAILDSNLPGSARDGLWFRIRNSLKKLTTRASRDPLEHHQRTASVKLKQATCTELVSNRDDVYLTAITNYRALRYGGSALFIEASLAGDYSSFGWRRLVSELELHTVQTDHLGVLEPGSVEHVAKLLKKRLCEIAACAYSRHSIGSRSVSDNQGSG